MLPGCFEGEGPWSMGNSIRLWVCIPLSQACTVLGLPHRLMPTEQMFWEIKVATSSIQGCAHPPAPPKRLVILSIFSPIYFPSLPLFAFQTPISSLALPAVQAVPAGKGSLCSHSPHSVSGAEPGMAHRFSTPLPCLWHLGLLGWEAQGPVTLGMFCSTPEPLAPYGWEELRGVTASRSDVCLCSLQIPAALLSPQSPGCVSQSLLKS